MEKMNLIDRFATHFTDKETGLVYYGQRNYHPFMRRFFSLALLLAFSQLSAPLVFAESPPNVVIILADDQGWGDLSIHGNRNLSTPNIDTLARDGALFDRFFVCRVCAPTRAEFLTGRYYPRTGVRGGAPRAGYADPLYRRSLRAAP